LVAEVPTPPGFEAEVVEPVLLLVLAPVVLSLAQPARRAAAQSPLLIKRVSAFIID
jgi:hypothetical protein